MLLPRIIPVLLLKNQGLVKTLKFADPKYIGDPINAVKIFNEKEVDEIIILDINATCQKRKPDFEWVKDICSEAFMPLTYGGGVTTVEDIGMILKNGAEKVAINTKALEDVDFIKRASRIFGSQSIMVSIDVKKSNNNYEIYGISGQKKMRHDLLSYVQSVEKAGAGEILINSIDRDGIMEGYDLDLVYMVSSSVSIPVIACGGAGELKDCQLAINKGKAQAVAAGSFFFFCGSRDAVLISYPERNEVDELFSKL